MKKRTVVGDQRVVKQTCMVIAPCFPSPVMHPPSTLIVTWVDQPPTPPRDRAAIALKTRRHSDNLAISGFKVQIINQTVETLPVFDGQVGRPDLEGGVEKARHYLIFAPSIKRLSRTAGLRFKAPPIAITKAEFRMTFGAYSQAISISGFAAALTA